MADNTAFARMQDTKGKVEQAEKEKAKDIKDKDNQEVNAESEDAEDKNSDEEGEEDDDIEYEIYYDQDQIKNTFKEQQKDVFQDIQEARFDFKTLKEIQKT